MKRLCRIPELPETSLSLVRLCEMVDVTLDAICSRVRHWRLPVENSNGRKALSAKSAYAILAFYASCAQAEAAKTLHVREATVAKIYNRGELNGYRFRGRLRIFLESVDQLKRDGVFDPSVVDPSARGFARYSKDRLTEIQVVAEKAQKKSGRLGHRWTKKEAEQAREKRWGKKI